MHSASWFLGCVVMRNHQTRGDKVVFQGRRHRGVIRQALAPQSDPPAPKKSPILRASRRVHQHRLQAEFVLLGGGGRGRRGSASVRLEGSWGKVRSSESRRRNIVREGARVASGEPARAIEGADRPFAARGFSSVGYAKSGWGGTHRQLVAVLGPPPVGLRGLLPVLLTARVRGEAGTSGPMRRRARDGPVRRRRGNPRRWAIRG